MSIQVSSIPGDLVVGNSAKVLQNLTVKNNTYLNTNLCVCNNIKVGSSKKIDNSKKRLEVLGKMDVTGTTTFYSLPIMSKVPIDGHHLVNKAYVDTKLDLLGANINNIIKPDESILDKHNVWTGKNVYNVVLPTSTLLPTSGNHFTNKTYVDSFLTNNNNWKGRNNFNSFLPTSNLKPQAPNELVNKAYVDNLSIDSLLNSNNIWQGTNHYNILPTSNQTVQFNNQLTTKEYVDNMINNPTNLLTSNNIWLGTNTFNILPTSTASVILNAQLTTKEYVDNAINNHVGSAISVSPGSSSNYLTFVTGTSGNQALYVDSGITYNATTDTLTVVNATITGNCNATVTRAENSDNVNIVSTTSTNNNCSVVLVANQSTGYQPLFLDTGITYNANTDTLTVSSVSGDLNGTATNANNINIRSTSSSDTTCSVVLVGNQATGNQQPFIDGGLMYNANTDNLSASSFTGNLIGDVSGRVNTNSLKVGSSNGSNITQILLGSGTLTSSGGGMNTISIGTLGITTSSKIFITFTLRPVGISWYYITPDRDQFIITSDVAPANDASFNWVAYN